MEPRQANSRKWQRSTSRRKTSRQLLRMTQPFRAWQRQLGEVTGTKTTNKSWTEGLETSVLRLTVQQESPQQQHCLAGLLRQNDLKWQHSAKILTFKRVIMTIHTDNKQYVKPSPLKIGDTVLVKKDDSKKKSDTPYDCRRCHNRAIGRLRWRWSTATSLIFLYFC